MRWIHAILCFVLLGCGHSANGDATTPAARRISAAVASINAFCNQLAMVTKAAQGSRLFASLAANGVAMPWREYERDDLQSRLQTLGTNQVAEFWQRQDGAVLVQTSSTVDTGDWNQTARYCYQPDGNLARTEFTHNSFVEDEGMRGTRVRHFVGGRQI